MEETLEQTTELQPVYTGLLDETHLERWDHAPAIEMQTI